MKITANEFRTMKGKRQIAMLTAYTTPIASCLERAAIPIILVGDTVGMVEMGFSTTRMVTLEHMYYHVGAVRRGAPHTHIIGDLPFGTYNERDTALLSAKKLLSAGADSIKLEGPKYEIIEFLAKNSIPIVGHTGLTPQTSKNFKQVGKTKADADRILEEAKGIETSGAFLIILEHIPDQLGSDITHQLAIPTIGIGAGKECDGQVLVINDLLGMGESWPPFSRQYANVNKIILDAASVYRNQVESKKF